MLIIINTITIAFSCEGGVDRRLRKELWRGIGAKVQLNLQRGSSQTLLYVNYDATQGLELHTGPPG